MEGGLNGILDAVVSMHPPTVAVEGVVNRSTATGAVRSVFNVFISYTAGDAPKLSSMPSAQEGKDRRDNHVNCGKL